MHSIMMFLFLTLLLYTCANISAQNPCHEYKMQERQSMAGVVVSGTVKKLMQDEVHSTKEHRILKGVVEIKRIFKGEDVVDKMAQIRPGRLRPLKTVVIDGFGDPTICDNFIRERETKIFMVNPNGNGELKLNSSIVPLTLNNLDHVDAVVKDIPFTTPPPVTVSPCYLQFCPFGATCRVNETDNTPMCMCEQRCSQVFAPVCGNDGATYSNLCMLNRGSCIHKRLIRVKSQGVCGVRDPCEGKVCQFGAECMPSIDGKTARCQCPRDCASYGDNLGSKPVCGNDGKDYKNWCELRSAACFQLKDIRVKYYGKCDPCEGYECEAPKVCHVNASREPECNCNYICFSDINLVCGTDGRTYSNQCVLKKQACKSRKDIRVLYQGKCSPENNPCTKIQCGPEEECTVDRTGRASCVCPPRCEPVLRRVCGNDSTTYDNECELRRQSCLNKVYVTMSHPGACNSDSPCNGFRCEYGSVCAEVGGKAVCHCPQCTEEYKPVCGENGITYENECKLRQENCRREEDVQVKKSGPCDNCGQSRCEFYATCDSANGKPSCICPSACVAIDAKVCGSDGVTYSNECELRVKSCQTKRFLAIASTGSCDKCKGVECKFSAKCENGVCVCPINCPTIREPVCASDDNSYINECEMRKMACTKSIDLEVVRDGECESDSVFFSGSGEGSGDFTIDDEDLIPTSKPPQPIKKLETCSKDNCIRYGGSCELDGIDYACSCKFKCPATRQPVCGSDGRTYGNECMMLHNSCIKKQIITEQSMDNCDEFDDEEACDGSAPLVNALTKNDYDCSPGKETCPSRSYCHITISFSKCCKQVSDSEPIRDCSETEFGCCKDDKTPALAPRGGGCPDVCWCHPMGSYTTTCDPRTRQCQCKPGVGGKRCDRCEVGYWGMHRIGQQGNAGCIPCNCNKFGSHRDDCEQMTGRCMCRASVIGMKCDTCSSKGNRLGPEGCSGDSYAPMSCEDLNCQYGSTCRDENPPVCVCEHECDIDSQDSEVVCGTDGQNYGSQCQMEHYACRMKKDLSVLHKGLCKGAPPTLMTTPSPVTKSRKTTRDIGDNTNNHNNAGDNQEPENKNQKDNDGKLDKIEECKGSNIEDLCLTDDDCCPNNSYCRGLCYCHDGYIPSIDNTQCFEVKKNPPKNDSKVSDACSGGDLCVNGGECVPDDYLGYRCACPIGKAGPRCNKDIEFKTPSFSGRSHLEMPHIEDAKRDLSIDIVFSSLNQDGIILFNAKFKNGTGDFVSLSVKGGFVEFRYDLGGGPAILRSRNPIEPKSSHRVTARRSKEMGELIVNNEEVVRGSSPSTHTSLDLNDPMFLGYIPKVGRAVYERVGVDLGLVGCIYSLRAGSPSTMYAYSLSSTARYPDIIRGVDITECGKNPCKSMPCLNGATCLVLDAQIYECRCRDGYKGPHCEKLMNPCASEPCQYGGTCLVTSTDEGFFCQCPHGREGARCEKELIPQLFVPQFTGDSYMQMPLEERISNSLSITVWFKSFTPNGVIFFATQSPGGRGDFIALNLKNKKLIFSFFLGSEIATIESVKHIHMDKWHEVTVTRTGKDGQMSIDGHSPVKGSAGHSFDFGGSASLLNINNRPLYVGGFNSTDDLPPRAGIENGLTGAIQRIIINGRTIDGLMASALTMSKVSEYNGPPCNVNPCMNDGVCIPILNRVECRCPTGFIGKNCEKRYDHVDKDQPLQFDGLTYLSYPNEVTRKQKGQQRNAFKVTFRTTDPDGVLLLQRGGDSAIDDYLSLAISNGFVEFSYNLGKQDPGNLHIIRSKERVNDGDWHEVYIERYQRQGSLKLDGGEEVVGESLEGTKQLDTDGLLWIGGHMSLPWYLPTTKNFVGCIDKVDVNGVQLHLLDDKFDHSSSIAFCSF